MGSATLTLTALLPVDSAHIQNNPKVLQTIVLSKHLPAACLLLLIPPQPPHPNKLAIQLAGSLLLLIIVLGQPNLMVLT